MKRDRLGRLSQVPKHVERVPFRTRSRADMIQARISCSLTSAGSTAHNREDQYSRSAGRWKAGGVERLPARSARDLRSPRLARPHPFRSIMPSTSPSNVPYPGEAVRRRTARSPGLDPAPAECADGPRGSLDADYTALYTELREVARRQLRRSPALTLGTTALVHESYLKLAALPGREWRSRGEFFVLAARAMRHILVDHARARCAGKRGGGALQVTLHPELAAPDQPLVDLLALDAALARLGARSERMQRIVECRFFGGLSVQETAEALDVSLRTVEREWTRARTYLFQELVDGPR
jgi:RNA polymerase sigma-70 factor, ECF subfamily